jgi:hypothetical protein
MDLKSIFQKYAGREIAMTVEQHTIKSKRLGDMTFDEVRLADPQDPLIMEMSKTAERHGLSLRLWWPGRIGTMEINNSRVNAHIVQGDDGKWRIGENFNIG